MSENTICKGYAVPDKKGYAVLAKIAASYEKQRETKKTAQICGFLTI